MAEPIPAGTPALTLDALRVEFKRLRERLGISQREVAATLDLTQASISQFENSTKQHPRKTTIHKIRQLVEIWKSDMSNVHQLPRAPRATGHRCPSCALSVPGPKEGARHCLKCGFAFPLACESCGNDNPGASRYCNQCGASLLDEEEQQMIAESVGNLPFDEDALNQAVRETFRRLTQEVARSKREPAS